MTPLRKILLDTDVGSDVDDALALGLILASPDELALVAVTTVAGDTELRARIAARLLGVGGRPDVEVCIGERAPVLRSAKRVAWFQHEAASLPAGPDAAIGSEPAPERIVRAAREVEDLEIVLIGPMINLARALAIAPDLPQRVRGVTIMGGHVREVRIGQLVCQPGIDYNLCADPEATMCVLGAGFRTTLVSADVTLQTWLRSADLERLERAGSLARALAAQVRVWAPVQRKLFTGLGGTLADDNVAFLHDPLTIWSLIDPSPLAFESLRIVPTIERGVLRTLEVEAAAGIGAEMRVATGVDAAAAERGIMERLLRL